MKQRISIVFRKQALTLLVLFVAQSAFAEPNSVGIDMVKIQSGSFVMAGCKLAGCPKDDPFTLIDESKNCGSGEDACKSKGDEVAHKVTLTQAFYLGKTEVTQKQYYTVTGNNPSYFLSEKLGHHSADNPVEKVTWFDAIKFANALSQKEGLPKCYSDEGKVIGGATVYACKGYRLPTEAEWEYAARAGTKGMRYGKLDDIAWYDTNSGDKTHPVGKKQPNQFGLFDMLGNVDEWCHDWYGEYRDGPQTNPTSLKTFTAGILRVYRGGTYDAKPDYVRAAFRDYGHAPQNDYSHRGFRLARSAP